MQHNTQIFSVKENFTGCIFTHVTLAGGSGIKLIIFRQLHTPYLKPFFMLRKQLCILWHVGSSRKI